MGLASIQISGIWFLDIYCCMDFRQIVTVWFTHSSAFQHLFLQNVSKIQTCYSDFRLWKLNIKSLDFRFSVYRHNQQWMINYRTSEFRTYAKSRTHGNPVFGRLFRFITKGWAFGYSYGPWSDAQFAAWKSDSCPNSKWLETERN